MALRRVASTYQRALDCQPLITKVGTGLTTATVGDALCQQIVLMRNPRGTMDRNGEPIGAFDHRRMLGFAAYGAIVTGGVQHYLFAWLSQRYPTSAGVRGVVTKVALQQFFFVPVIYYPCFYALSGVARQFSPQQVWEQVCREHLDIQLTNWAFWLPFQAVMFARVPTDKQVLVASCGSVVFNTILSFLSNRGLQAGSDKLAL
eukprot:TRINITY_DN30743_c0_g1_i2.p1 TRINITY_DN30743_c0_g1~~TRINITY_DN30743_c0_g1_i2.p1  ORF type:complete len:203 (+),score=11.01 TRINITY_DN30743_c0_g1_i2:50-658(+)